MSLPNIFKALSDPVRREILLKLKQKRKMSAGEIAAEFDLTNATISYHLSTLKKADLIFETRYQKYIYYEINTSVFESVVMWLMQFQGCYVYCAPFFWRPPTPHVLAALRPP